MCEGLKTGADWVHRWGLGRYQETIRCVELKSAVHPSPACSTRHHHRSVCHIPTVSCSARYDTKSTCARVQGTGCHVECRSKLRPPRLDVLSCQYVVVCQTWISYRQHLIECVCIWCFISICMRVCQGVYAHKIQCLLVCIPARSCSYSRLTS